MKKIFLTIAILTIILIIPVSASASQNSSLASDLNNYVKTNTDADFTKATVKGKTITVTVDDSYVEDPVEEVGRESFLSDVFSQVKGIQKKHGTKYTLIIKDKKSGKLAKANYKGNGWVRNSNDKTETNEYDFN